MRKPAAVLLCTTGVFLLSFAGVRYGLGIERQDAARRSWEEADASARVADARRALRTPLEGTADGAVVARLIIPRIQLDAIVFEGVDADDLDGGPGHVPGSAMPGELGNAVISAHRDRHFNHLDAVSIGDTIRTEAGELATTWIVTSRRLVGKESPALFRTAGATLTLTTCWPVRYVGPAPERLILTAKPVGEKG